MWSQYLEVGIGPDAEIFTKAQPMSAVGTGAEIGIHPTSNWNNPEPEIVLAVNAAAAIVGATLGNDVNLRDFEGRSALLLGKAKDNNASCAIGPFIRLFDEQLRARRRAPARGRADASTGTDGFALDGAQLDVARSAATRSTSSAQTIGAEPPVSRTASCCSSARCSRRSRTATRPAQGFTHKVGDVVTDRDAARSARWSTASATATESRPGPSAPRALMRNLAARGLLK